ncbi:diguanylate cyclase [Pleomorphomonas oryzae]|uniref:diguanylate cyclase n=1 Tax=Pleomorphomonas oryzae TaxID=261934 RepID=UPI0003F921A7|nr:diguanylate cyclase [Pleomorphomonas oryzae]
MFDIPTVFILISVLSLTLGGAIRVTQTTELKWGLHELSYGLIAHGIAYGLFTLSPSLGLGAVWLAEVSIALFFSFVIQALEVFFGRKKRWIWHLLLIGSIALVAALLLDNRPARTMCDSLILIATEATILRFLWARRATTPGRGQYLIVAAILLNLTTLFYRELTAVYSLQASGAISMSELSQALLYTATLVGLTLLTVGFLLMAKERTEHLNQQMILSDKLTGVWNRRKLEEVAEGEIQRLVRHGTLASLLILDLDDFKAINDSEGHAAGDAVLQAVTSSWQTILRDTDVLGRWGGEEFVVVLPGTGVRDALLLAEALRDATSATDIGNPRRVTVSIGVSLCLSYDSWKSWFDRADAALYRAKAAGKDRVSHDIPMEWEDGLTLINWSSMFETSVPELDADHRQLVKKVNQLLRNVRTSGNKAAISQDLNEIGLDMRRHFAREEVAIADVSPDDLQKHRFEHAALVARLGFLTERFQRDALPLEALVQFMAFEMCAHHIAGSDRRLFSKPGL